MFSLNNALLTLAIFRKMCAIHVCLSHFNLESKITHKKMNWDTLLIATVFNLRTE